MTKISKILLYIFIFIIIITFVAILFWKLKINSFNLFENNFNQIETLDLSTNNLILTTYNINGMPFKKLRDPFSNLNPNSTIICLQENFYDSRRMKIIKKFAEHYRYNVIIPKENNMNFKLLNSGLTILTKLNIIDYKFIPWKHSSNVDKLANKGFIHALVRFGSDILNIFNLHLQAVYTEELDTKFEGYKDTRYKPLKQLEKYITNQNISNFIICGDYNTPPEELKFYKLFEKFNYYYTREPTIYSNFETGDTNCVKLNEKYLPNKLDYFITSKNIICNDLESKCYKDSDHKMVVGNFKINNL
jgi:exonuclease III